jgi:membrane fusion protein (multidrug efflux system)
MSELQIETTILWHVGKRSATYHKTSQAAEAAQEASKNRSLLQKRNKIFMDLFKMKRLNLRVVKAIVYTSCASAGFAVLGCGHTDHHEVEIPTFSVTSPVREDTSLTREHVCQIRSIRRVELRALEKGYVDEIFIDEGQFVKAGTMLFQVMPRLYKAEYERAKAEVDFANIEYENTARLRKKNIVAESELNLAKAKLDMATAELALAKTHLDFTEVRAPFDGITGRLNVRSGSLVEEGELLTTLSDNSEMWVYFNVPESEYIEFKSVANRAHQRDVKLVLANNQVYQYPGNITAIEADFNNETGNIAFRATFPNPNGLLRHGQTGNIILETPLEDALLIPQKATFEILDKRYVYRVDGENKIRTQQVDVLAELPDVFAIQKGLSEQDTILLAGLRRVRDGDEINPSTEDPKQVLSKLQVYAE